MMRSQDLLDDFEGGTGAAMIRPAYHIRLVHLSLSKGLAAVYIGVCTTKAKMVARDTASQELQQLCCLLQAEKKT